MPFRETCRMEERIRMMMEYDTGNWSVSDLCRRFGVCRDTFYEWRARRASDARDWFLDRSHAPWSCPHATPAELRAKIISLRKRFRYLGPRKLLVKLRNEWPELDWPAASTIGDILKRANLIEPVKRRRRAIGQQRPFAAVMAPNDEWNTDFKGWFRTADHRRIDPLTLTDSDSRFLIDIRIVPPTIAGAQPAFAAAFRSYGLPLSIRCDNGSPFGSSGAGGLTRLSAWWLKLGIEPHFIHPASPQENGRHERMHRTLKEQTSRPPAANAAAQQRRFDAFRRHYNEERPHEALGQRAPAELYAGSARPMPARIEEPWYDADHQVRRVRSSGEIMWKGDRVFISEALVGELVGVAELETGDHVVRFCDLDIGLIDACGRFGRFAPRRDALCEPAEPKSVNVSGIIPVQNVDNHPG
jgi:transposase InsO family protein